MARTPGDRAGSCEVPPIRVQDTLFLWFDLDALADACLWGVSAARGSFPSCHQEARGGRLFDARCVHLPREVRSAGVNHPSVEVALLVMAVPWGCSLSP